MNTIHHKLALYVGIFFCLFVFLYICLRLLISSAFFSPSNRINVLFYSEVPVYFSLEKNGEVHYTTSFQAEGRVAVPGGYGVYRLGALGKLAYLEKNPELLNRSFSRITGSMLNYYFYPRTDTIFYGKKDGVHLPSIGDIFLLESNANVFDRLYLWLQFIGKRTTDFHEIHIKKIVTGDDILLSDTTFAEQYLGYFYQKRFRKENKTVQILYSSSYMAAKNISRIIDGEGIRVVDIDIDQGPKLKTKSCIVMENTTGRYSYAAEKIASFFQCSLARGKGRVSDIVVELGEGEKLWE